MAERLAHEARQEHRHRSPAQPARGRHAAQQGRRADRPVGHEPRRRLQPRLDDDREGPRARQPGGAPAHPRAVAEQPRAQPVAPLSGRGLQRAHRQAPPGLGRARLERDHRRQPDAADPPGQELHRGPALRRGAAQPQGRERQEDQEPPQRQARVQAGAPKGRDQAPRPDLPRLVVHRRERAQPRRPRPAHPRRRLQVAGRLQPARPEGRREGAGVQDHHRHQSDADRGQPDRPARRRDDDWCRAI